MKKLCEIISPKIQVNDEMTRYRTGKDGLAVEIMLHCLFSWLGGDSYLDIILSAGISPAKLYSCIYECLHAILDSEALAYKLLSLQAAIKGWVTCIDGYFFILKFLDTVRQAMPRYIFQDIIKSME